MIHTARTAAKFVTLKRKLRELIPKDLPVDTETIAVGLLESLWHFTIRNCPRGNIGIFTDELIAEGIGWLGDHATIVSILIECKWLDVDANHRLIVHDWHDHAPGFIKKNIWRKDGFVTNTNATEQTSGDIIAQANSLEQFSGDVDAQVSQDDETPNLTKHNQSNPNKTNPAAASPPAAARFDFSRLEDTEEHREAARLAAEKLHKAGGNVLTREFIWSVAWISEGTVRGFCSEMHDKLKSGGVNKYRRYVERALEGELAKIGVTFAQCSEFVPPVGSQGKSSSVQGAVA